jgi:3'-phosphoadenosine 5'-phosphosulfate sulfotransferase (PAPS reductase)/FAD synthetase
VTDATGNGGIFDNGDGVQGKKSQFNKEKWLPLARDIPVMVSHQCCQVMKKAPLHAFQKKSGLHPILATMADESRVRTQAWLRAGCNAFDGANPKSQPMSFWTEQDVLQYIIENNLEIASVYGDIVATDAEGNEYDPNGLLMDGCKLSCTGCQRTGCIFCAFGAHLEKGETRFQRLARTHPRQYEYCMMGGQWVDNPAYDPTAPEYDGEWKNWNPKKIWMPSDDGLGMKQVFDMVNEIYGKDFYRYD